MKERRSRPSYNKIIVFGFLIVILVGGLLLMLPFSSADGSWTVLDYKTDAKEEPSIYFNQLAAYKKTAADLFAGGDPKMVHCALFYAETGRFVDISQEAQKALESLDDEKIFNLIEKQEIL